MSRRRGRRGAARTVAIAGLALIAGIVPMSGCAIGKGAGANSGTQLTVVLPPSEKPFWEPIARTFEAAHPGVRVELIEGPQSTNLREDLYTASLLAHDPTFDLVYMDVIWTAKFASAGWLLPFDDKLRPGETDAFLPASIEAGRYRGKLYRWPVRTDCGVLYYRRDLLEQAGFAPPRDFADLIRIARALEDPPKRWGFVWQGKQYEGLVCDYLEVLRGFGGFWVNPATLQVGLDRPEAAAALKFLQDCIHGTPPISPPGVTTYTEEESRRLFQDGRAVFLRNWPYCWRLAQAPDSPIHGKVGVMSMVHTPEGRSAGTLGGWGLGISAFSRHPDLALAFVRHATTLASERALCLDTGYAPALRAAYDDSLLRAANPFLEQLLRLHANAVPRPQIARYALVSDILQRHLSSALSGQSTAERALAAAARETRAVLGREAGS